MNDCSGRVFFFYWNCGELVDARGVEPTDVIVTNLWCVLASWSTLSCDIDIVVILLGP